MVKTGSDVLCPGCGQKTNPPKGQASSSLEWTIGRSSWAERFQIVLGKDGANSFPRLWGYLGAWALAGENMLGTILVIYVKCPELHRDEPKQNLDRETHEDGFRGSKRGPNSYSCQLPPVI